MIFNLEIEHAEWTTLVMDAIAQAERNPTKELYIRIVLQQHTLH